MSRKRKTRGFYSRTKIDPQLVSNNPQKIMKQIESALGNQTQTFLREIEPYFEDQRRMYATLGRYLLHAEHKKHNFGMLIRFKEMCIDEIKNQDSLKHLVGRLYNSIIDSIDFGFNNIDFSKESTIDRYWLMREEVKEKKDNLFKRPIKKLKVSFNAGDSIAQTQQQVDRLEYLLK